MAAGKGATPAPVSLDRLGLRAEALAYLDALDPADRKVLTDAVLAAEARGRARVERAIENAVHYVPALLRPAVRRFLLG